MHIFHREYNAMLLHFITIGDADPDEDLGIGFVWLYACSTLAPVFS